MNNRTYHISGLESYKHKAAIMVLNDWIIQEPEIIGFKYGLNTILEKEFYIDSLLSFIPDITVFSNDQIVSIFEVVHKNSLTDRKIGRIQLYKYLYNKYFEIYEIESEWILSQVTIPYKLNSIKMI